MASNRPRQNIVGVHDVRIEGNFPYLICEYVDGETHWPTGIARVAATTYYRQADIGQKSASRSWPV